MNHLLAISVGPVQEFIAAARRTRDLWFGSYLLSEISKAVANSVKDNGGKLIFPHPDTNLTSGDDKVNVANIILAEIPVDEPKDVAANAKQAAQKRWHEFASEARKEASGVIRTEIWDEQVDDVIEFHAAWTACSGNYKDDRAKVMRLLAGRKNLRDFQAAFGRAGVPKSSLDGQRESILKDPTKERWPERFRTRLRVREGEQLDVVGFVKRVAGGNQSYPSVSRIAADPWIRANRDKPAFKTILELCKELPGEVLHRLNETVFPQFQDFPFEGTAIYRSRHHEWEEEIDDSDRVSLGDLQDELTRLPVPSPYLAVLVADGDRMGAAISALGDVNAHRNFSCTLAGFVTTARSIVNNYNGVLVYAGGDDVLAFLPVDKCLSCARELRDQFVECLKPCVPINTPTLSVGIAIGHFMDNLEDLLNYGRTAERAAKKVEGKDALAVHLHKRGGSPIRIADRWGNSPEKRLLKFASLMNQGIIPTKLPYELRAMAKLYERWTDNTDTAIQQDLYRLIAKKSSRGIETVRKELATELQGMDSNKLISLAQELLVARQLARVLKQETRQSAATEEVLS